MIVMTPRLWRPPACVVLAALGSGDYYSNALTVPGPGGQQGEPVTPVLQAKAGQATRIHITNPHGTTRGSTFTLHGHVWQRDPYVCPATAQDPKIPGLV